MAKVSIERLKKTFGSAVAVSDFSLDIADGELVAFLGPSGCGKTTTLRMIAGFIEPTAGTIRIGDDDVTHMPVHKRNTGMVFQRYALFPHMTVSQNVMFGLEMHKVEAGERDKRMRAALDMVRMSQFHDRYPRQLSGGQQQRVAIARALAIQPRVFLLDEPLSNLDAKLRLEVREEIRDLQRNLGLTTIFVTHDQEEALAIADRMAIMYDGKVQQIGSPEALYERPSNLFVADFLGKMNFFEGSIMEAGKFRTKNQRDIAIVGADRDTKKVGVRPERVTLSAEPQGPNALAGVIDTAIYLGSIIDVRIRLDSGESVSAQISNRGGEHIQHLSDGARMHACFDPADCVLFSE
ncbi:ABC transporter ATP-binding protein [Bordetella genomosp. 4]|uniref:Fe3+/spermidine/putrescine ABC transporter ATP-binding protein n=1 Tax=Bordetella genomosp. 4 TaxID=463044 RepID=A0A261TPD1_9BORD|nr:ABC transporter ATP-binding protein [Bordetella genomosp. 4]OZI42909.1 Fe3+/spermidine/putrescine ABC transporter ATP-binding protein [Bordetella genomosp. 4]OZI50473.1 Fe3+/spermidine/putrescine ABC transporter ATP-binding protein [Bordetella genomosp. 4]